MILIPPNILAKIKALVPLKKSAVLHTRPIATPVRDWKIILLCGTLGILVCGSFALFVYVYDSAAPEDTGNQTVSRSKVKEAEIKNMLQAFEARAQAHAEYQTKRTGLVDPSR